MLYLYVKFLPFHFNFDCKTRGGIFLRSRLNSVELHHPSGRKENRRKIPLSTNALRNIPSFLSELVGSTRYSCRKSVSSLWDLSLWHCQSDRLFCQLFFQCSDREKIFHYVQEDVKISKKQGIDDIRIVSGSVRK